jgi:hypothetical protein
MSAVLVQNEDFSRALETHDIFTFLIYKMPFGDEITLFQTGNLDHILVCH